MGNEFSDEVNKMDTIVKRLQYFYVTVPERELFVFYRDSQREPYTVKQVYELGGKFARRLRQLGFGHRDVIANTLPNSPERLITMVGAMMAGCTMMNGQILLADGADFFKSVTVSRCKCVIVCPRADMPAWKLLKGYVKAKSFSLKTDMTCDKAPDMTSAILVTREPERSLKPLLEELKTSKEEIFVEPGDPEDIVAIFTTSGSTGYSKLVPRSNTEILSMGRDMDVSIDNSSERNLNGVYYNDRQLGWVGGYPFTTFLFAQKRVLSDMWTCAGYHNGPAMWNVVTREKCNTAVILPLDLDRIITYVDSLPPGTNKHRLQCLFSGGQPVKRFQVKNLLKLSEEVLIGYGSTEGGIFSAAFLKDANFEDCYCGKILDNIQLKIVDESGEVCEPMKVGTVHVKGPSIFKGYFNRQEDPDPQTIAAFTEDGWFDTQDQGFFDADRNLYVIGRTKDTIIHGSVVLYPGWLEIKISSHPDVAEAVVVPVSDPVLYQKICACVKPESGSDLTEDKLRDFCEKLFLSSTQQEITPMPAFFMILPNFPQTSTGKPDKQKLREMAEERFGIQEKGN